jgi:hypothetical protein
MEWMVRLECRDKGRVLHERDVDLVPLEFLAQRQLSNEHAALCAAGDRYSTTTVTIIRG